MKKYKAGFIIGSFDVFHSGHLENIQLASQFCNTLYIVLKTDERIIEKKHKVPKQSTAERAAILKGLKLVKDVLYMDLDSTRQDVIDDIIQAYERAHDEQIELQDIVGIFGEDLKEKEEAHLDEWQGIEIVFTPRPPEKMASISSTRYQREIDENGGLSVFESAEDNALRK